MVMSISVALPGTTVSVRGHHTHRNNHYFRAMPRELLRTGVALSHQGISAKAGGKRRTTQP